MAAMIWDSNQQAFVDSKIPPAYNPQIEAWQDTEGFVHNPELGAWEKVWPQELVIYDHGAESVSMHFANNKVYPSIDSDTGVRCIGSGISTDKINFDLYNKASIICDYNGILDYSVFARLSLTNQYNWTNFSNEAQISDGNIERDLSGGLVEVDLSGFRGERYFNYGFIAQTRDQLVSSVRRESDRLVFTIPKYSVVANVYKIWLE